MVKIRSLGVALVLSGALAACAGTPPAGVTPSDAGTGSGAPTTPPSGATTGPATGAASVPPTGGSASPTSGSASPTASSAPVQMGILRGQVYSNGSNFVPDGTTVTVTSLDPNRPFTASAVTASGSYVVNQVPIDVQVQVSATRPGWTTRSRVLVVRAADPKLTDRNVYNFGGPSGTVDPAGPAFYLSDHPEIESVEPVDQDTSQPNDQMHFKLAMSEPLDATNQRRLASAFLLIPNSQEAEGANDFLPTAGCTSGSGTQTAAVTVDYATTGSLPSYGAAGGVLTANANGALSIDGASPSAGQVILVKDEAGNPARNGLYTVTVAGDGTTPFKLTRTSTTLAQDLRVLVSSGTANGGHTFNLGTSNPIVTDTTALAFGDLGIVTSSGCSADLAGLRIGTDPLTVPTYRYRQNAGFLSGFAVSQFTWSDDGKTATFSLQAPVKTGNLKEGQYAFLLVSQNDDKIQDQNGMPLGMDSQKHWGGYTKGQIIFSGIKRTGLVLASSASGTDEDRWFETHQTWSGFSVAKDTVAPKLVSVLARRNYVDANTSTSDRVELTFSKPMVAFPAIMSPSLLSLNNYVVTAADTQENVAKHDVANLKAKPVLASASVTDVRDAIGADVGMVVNSNAASEGNFSIRLGVSDPKVVILSMPAGSLPLNANFVKVYAGSDSNASTGANKSVGDPADNAIDSTANTAVGQIF